MKVFSLFLVLALLTPLLGCNQADSAAQTPPAQSETQSPNASPPSDPSPNEVLAAAPTVEPTNAALDWPSFLGPHRDSKSPETGILTKWPAEGPPILWQRQLGEGYGMGSISQGRYFQFDRIGEQARLVALHAGTGELLWEFQYHSEYADLYGYDSGPRASPVIDGDRVYIYGVEGMLHCLNVATGKVIWKLDANKRFGVIQNFFGVGSTPVVEGDLLLVMVGGSPPASQNVPPGALDQVEPNGTGIVALNKLTGEVKYQLADDLASYSSPIVTTMGERRHAFAFLRGALWGFNPTTGEVDFRYPWRAPSLESVNASTPVVVGDEVFISETYGPGSSLLKVTPQGYEIVWRDDLKKRDKALQTHWNTSIHVDGYLYGSSGRHETNAELRCVQWSTGKVMWSEFGLTRSSLLYADGHFVCLSEDGTLRLLRVNPEKYDVVAEVMLRDTTAGPSPAGLPPPRLLKPPAWAAPVLSHGLLYVRGEDRLVCLELIPGAAKK